MLSQLVFSRFGSALQTQCCPARNHKLPQIQHEANMRAAPKVMPPISWCWPTMSETDVDDRRQRQMYNSRSWIFLPIFCYILLSCDRWQHRGSQTKWCLMWTCVGSKGVELNFSMWKKWHPLTFIYAYWMFLETKQWVWVWGEQWVGCFSSGDGDSGSHLLVQVFTGASCRLFFITGKNS